MARQHVASGFVFTIAIGLVVCMYCLTANVDAKEQSMREQGTRLSASEALAFDLQMWLKSYRLLLGLLVILGAVGVGAVIHRNERQRGSTASVEA